MPYQNFEHTRNHVTLNKCKKVIASAWYDAAEVTPLGLNPPVFTFTCICFSYLMWYDPYWKTRYNGIANKEQRNKISKNVVRAKYSSHATLLDRCPREMGTPQFGDPSPHIPSDMGTGGISLGIWGPGVPRTLVIWGSFSDLGTPNFYVQYPTGKDM